MHWIAISGCFAVHVLFDWCLHWNFFLVDSTSHFIRCNFLCFIHLRKTKKWIKEQRIFRYSSLTEHQSKLFCEWMVFYFRRQWFQIMKFVFVVLLSCKKRNNYKQSWNSRKKIKAKKKTNIFNADNNADRLCDLLHKIKRARSNLYWKNLSCAQNEAQSTKKRTFLFHLAFFSF